MPEENIILPLAKVLVAAAWADGQINNAELNSLKDLLFHLPGMTAEDWAQIDIYLDSPVDEAERQRLAGDLQVRLASPEQRNLALQALDQMLQADGQVSPAEQQAAAEIKSALEEAHTSSWSRLVHRRTQRRTQAVGPNRERYLDDFVKNKIYYEASRKMTAEGASLNISDLELRRLSLAGGLMARVAYADEKVSALEKGHITRALEQHWALSTEQAAIVAETAASEIAQGLDYYRLTREFFECTTEDERLRFLDALFALAASDGCASYVEQEEIRTIAYGLLLTHQEFITAKLKLPSEQLEL